MIDVRALVAELVRDLDQIEATDFRAPEYCIRASNKKLIAPLDPRPEDIDINFIAHGLSNISRYTGQAPVFYSVGQHVLLVTNELERRGAPFIVQLAGLHHDDPEALLNDIASPLKRSPFYIFYRALEQQMVRVVFERFEIPLRYLDDVKEVDYHLFERETAAWGWRDDTHPDLRLTAGTRYGPTIYPCPPGVSATPYLNRHQNLIEKIKRYGPDAR